MDYKHYITLTIPITPKAKERPRITRSKKGYTPKKTQKAEKLIGQHLWAYMASTQKRPMQCPVALEVEFHGGRGDIDNMAKTVMDACNGILYNDDKQVVALVCVKYKSSNPHIKLTAFEADGD